LSPAISLCGGGELNDDSIDVKPYPAMSLEKQHSPVKNAHFVGMLKLAMKLIHDVGI
jgi:hypothetical protein